MRLRVDARATQRPNDVVRRLIRVRASSGDDSLSNLWVVPRALATWFLCEFQGLCPVDTWGLSL